jgi:U4/U6.U5 tri-snRNP-associated protein 1
VYTGYDDEEFHVPGTAPPVLAKYDEVVQGTGFRAFEKSCPPNLESGMARTSCFCRWIVPVSTLLSLQQTRIEDGFAENLALVDYVQEGDFEFKKITVLVQYTHFVAIFQLTIFSIQTQKQRPSRRTCVEVDSEGSIGAMEIDHPPITPLKRRNLNYNSGGNDEAALKRSRQVEISKTKKLSTNCRVNGAAERIPDETKAAQENEGEETSDALSFDHTSEFIRSIQYNPTALEFHAMAASPPVKQRPHNI